MQRSSERPSTLSQEEGNQAVIPRSDRRGLVLKRHGSDGRNTTARGSVDSASPEAQGEVSAGNESCPTEENLSKIQGVAKNQETAAEAERDRETDLANKILAARAATSLTHLSTKQASADSEVESYEDKPPCCDAQCRNEAPADGTWCAGCVRPLHKRCGIVEDGLDFCTDCWDTKMLEEELDAPPRQKRKMHEDIQNNEGIQDKEPAPTPKLKHRSMPSKLLAQTVKRLPGVTGLSKQKKSQNNASHIRNAFRSEKGIVHGDQHASASDAVRAAVKRGQMPAVASTQAKRTMEELLDAEAEQDRYSEIVLNGPLEIVLQKLREDPGTWGTPIMDFFAPVLQCTKCSIPAKDTLRRTGRVKSQKVPEGKFLPRAKCDKCGACTEGMQLMKLMGDQLQSLKQAQSQLPEDPGAAVARGVVSGEYERHPDALELARELWNFKAEMTERMFEQQEAVESLRKQLSKAQKEVIQLREHNEKLVAKVAVLERQGPKITAHHGPPSFARHPAPATSVSTGNTDAPNTDVPVAMDITHSQPHTTQNTTTVACATRTFIGPRRDNTPAWMAKLQQANSERKAVA